MTAVEAAAASEAKETLQSSLNEIKELGVSPARLELPAIQPAWPVVLDQENEFAAPRLAEPEATGQRHRAPAERTVTLSTAALARCSVLPAYRPSECASGDSARRLGVMERALFVANERSVSQACDPECGLDADWRVKCLIQKEVAGSLLGFIRTFGAGGRDLMTAKALLGHSFLRWLGVRAITASSASEGQISQ